jgi:hypothetical protein
LTGWWELIFSTLWLPSGNIGENNWIRNEFYFYL